MKLQDMNGRRVKIIYFNDNELTDFSLVQSEQIATYSYEYHGDHAENWIVVEENGKEKYRWNTAKLQGIDWWD